MPRYRKTERITDEIAMKILYLQEEHGVTQRNLASRFSTHPGTIAAIIKRAKKLREEEKGEHRNHSTGCADDPERTG